jgi:hypothetical protein
MAGPNIEIILGGLAAAMRTQDPGHIREFLAGDAWNTRDPEKVAGAYTEDSVWRNRDEFLTGRAETNAFLRRVEPGAWLRAAQGPVGLPRQPDRRPLPVRAL